MMTKQAELKKQAYESDLKSRALSVLIYLIDRSNKDLTCFPAIPTMAEQLHISVSTVKRALHELVQAGFIKKDARFRDKNRGQTSNLYTLVPREEILESMDKRNLDSPVKHRETEQKSEKKAVCTVERLTFENLKEEKQQEDGGVDYLICQIEETIMDSTELKAECELAGESNNIRQFLIHTSDIIIVLRLVYQSKTDKLTMLLRQQDFPVLILWTGAGVNLHPP